VQRILIGVLSAGLLLAGCSGSSTPKASSEQGASAGEGGPDELFAETATFEVVAGKTQRLMVGLTTKDQRVLAGGSVRFSITPANADANTEKTAKPLVVDAAFLGLPGMPVVSGAARIGRPSAGIGVYAANVNIPTAGFWTIDVASSDKKKLAQTAVEVLAKPQVPAVGEPAPLTKNLTLASPGVQQQWLDSTATAESPADPLLHSTVIADAIAAKRPMVIVISTPAYCVSRFCGPVTELIRTRAEKAVGTDLAFVHLEVWREFEKTVVNKGAAEWILTNGAQGNEPWVFVVGRNGRIAARFDNVIDEPSLSAAIDAASKTSG
jgi:hypothetical protein